MRKFLLLIAAIAATLSGFAIQQTNRPPVYPAIWYKPDTAMLNPYMILSDQGITKHYYNGAQRVATQISDPFWLPSGTIVEPDGAEYAELAEFDTHI